MNNIFIADSSMLSKSFTSPIYSILSLSGNIETVNHTIDLLEDFFVNESFERETFETWYKNEGNGNKLLEFLLKIYNDKTKCAFNAYVSDHNYSKFLVYVKSLCHLDQEKQIRDIVNFESLYYGFDTELLGKIGTCEDKSLLNQLNDRLVTLLNSEIAKRKKTYDFNLQIANDAQRTMWETFNQSVLQDLSILDYFMYLYIPDGPRLITTENSIYASQHAAKLIDLSRKIQAKNGHLNDASNIFFELEKEEKNIKIFKKLLILMDYTWNMLHKSETIDNISEQDRLLLIIMWLLFQSNSSVWLLTSSDFMKIKKYFESFLQKN